jgi:hypothetical protein
MDSARIVQAIKELTDHAERLDSIENLLERLVISNEKMAKMMEKSMEPETPTTY